MLEQEKNSLFNIKDLAGISTPLTKLIETVGAGFGRASDGIGRIVNTYLLSTKEAENEAKNLLLIESVRTKIMTERAQSLASLSSNQARRLKSLDITDGNVSASIESIPQEVVSAEQRAEARVSYQNTLHQLNSEAVIEYAAAELSTETEVTSEPVDPDWVARFFNVVQDVSSESMQALWGKVLAGEVKAPGSYSLRTLEVIRNLTQQEAALFSDICNYIAVNFSSKIFSSFLYKPPHGSNKLLSPISYTNITKLIDCGLFHATAMDSFCIDFKPNIPPDTQKMVLKIGQYILLCQRSKYGAFTIELQKHSITKAAIEIYSLIDSKAPLEYVISVGRELQNSGFDKVQYAFFDKWTESGVDYHQPVKDLPSEV